MQLQLKSMTFERPFAEIWKFTPFRPSDRITEFVSRFTVDGAFEADRFWEYLALNMTKKRGPRRAASRPRKPKNKVV
jgi:hypothetical protein